MQGTARHNGTSYHATEFDPKESNIKSQQRTQEKELLESDQTGHCELCQNLSLDVGDSETPSLDVGYSERGCLAKRSLCATKEESQTMDTGINRFSPTDCWNQLQNDGLPLTI